MVSADERFRSIVETLPAVVYQLRMGSKTELIYVGAQVEEILGWPAEDYLAQPRHLLAHIHPLDQDRVAAALAESHASGAPWQLEYRVISRDGRIVWLRDKAVLASELADGSQIWHGMQIDISNDKVAESRLHRLAFYDHLTGLPNRRLCIDRLETILDRTEPGAAALLFLDLDRFKVINDGVGHAAGDELLIEVAKRLVAELKEPGSLARFGGDEFVVVLEQFTTLADVAEQAEALVAALRSPFKLRGYELIVEGTIGIAISSPTIATPDDLLRAADVALYRAKAKGGNTYAIFDPHIDQQGLERLDREAELRQALERGEFRIAYQPVFDISSRQILAVEALLRWDHPERGELPPSEFLPLADETGLIVPLGRWVVEEACRQMRQWQQTYPAARGLYVSVNLSGRQFRQPMLAAEVGRALEKSGLAPEYLALELKEGDALADASAISTTLKEFKRLGVKVTIDDFGKGTGALSSLTRFTVDDLKIDGSVVSRLGNQRQDDDIVRALVGMAKAIGLDVTAEAVETGEQLALLEALGCDRAQGRHFSPPVSASDMEQLFSQL